MFSSITDSADQLQKNKMYNTAVTSATVSVNSSKTQRKRLSLERKAPVPKANISPLRSTRNKESQQNRMSRTQKSRNPM